MRGNPPKDEVLAAMSSPGGLFPMIDRFGQYRHRNWPGKTQTLDDLRRQREAEQKDLQEHPGPKGWDTYGGWMDGPQLRATGFFRVEKYQGRWWLVDPGRVVVLVPRHRLRPLVIRRDADHGSDALLRAVPGGGHARIQVPGPTDMGSEGLLSAFSRPAVRDVQLYRRQPAPQVRSKAGPRHLPSWPTRGCPVGG